jgi:hypothetical protein
MKVRRLAILIGTFVLLAACSSEGGPIFGGGEDDPGTPFGQDQDDTTTATTAGSDDGFGFDDLGSAAGGDTYRPLPVREGLGTFDSYEWHMELTTVGPTAAERMSVITRWNHNADPLAHYSSIESTQEGPDFEEPETSTTEIFRVENDTCQFDGESWSYTGATDQQAEVLELTQRLIDFTIVPESPAEIGHETIAGIDATHWQYSVAGFGSDSGALVTENRVDYWVSNDTGVLLKYEMVVESRSGPSTDPEAEVYRVETSMELLTANTPVAIDLPQGCLDAKAESELEG